MNYLIIITSLCVLAVALRLFAKAAGTVSPFELNTVSFPLYFQLIPVGFVGPVLLATHSIDFHPLVQPISDSVKFEAWAWSMYALVAIPSGLLLLNQVFELVPRVELTAYKNTPFTGSPAFISSLFLFTGAAGALAYILLNTPTIPVIDLLQNSDLEQAAIDRVSSKYAFQGIDYVKSIFGLIMIPALSYYFFILAIKEKTTGYKLLFIGSFLLALALLVYDLQKAPIAFYLLGFLIINGFVSKRVNSLVASGIFIGAVAMLLIGYQLTTGKSAITQVTNYDSAFYGRIFISGYLAFPLSLELIPHPIDVQSALFLVPRPILEVYALEATDPARALMTHINYEGVQNGSANLISGFFLGEAWSSFRYVGLILAPWIVSISLGLVQLILLRLPKHPLILAFYTYISTKWLFASGFSAFLSFKVILFPLFVLFFIYILIHSFHLLKRFK